MQALQNLDTTKHLANCRLGNNQLLKSLLLSVFDLLTTPGWARSIKDNHLWLLQQVYYCPNAFPLSNQLQSIAGRSLLWQSTSSLWPNQNILQYPPTTCTFTQRCCSRELS